MASILPSTIRQSAIKFSSAAVKGPAYQTLSATSTFQRGGLSAARRGLSSLTWRQNVRANGGTRNGLMQVRGIPQLQKQVRWNSDEAETPALRQWKFEEINASLPSASPNSPSHSPVILIDVREPAELNGTGIIPTAINIPLATQADALFLTSDEFETRFGFPKPCVEGDGHIVFYCKAGVRAEAAADLAVQAGYDPATVGIYWGSWLDWERNGGKVERWEGDD